MRLDPPEQRRQHGAARADLVGQGRQAERHALPGVALGLAVERLMLPVLLEQDHRQQARAGPAARDHMERRRRLADLLAVAAGEFLADVLDHLPLPRDHLQRLGDVLAQLAQPRAAAALAGGRSRLDHPLARQMLGEGLARRALAGEGHDIRRLGRGALGGDLVLAGRTLEFLEGQLHLVEQPHRAFRALAVELRASASRSAIAGARSRRHRRKPWPWRPPVPPRPAPPWRARRSAPPAARQCLPAGLCGWSPCRNRIINPGRRLAENAAGLSRPLRPERMARVPPIDPVEHVGELRRRDGEQCRQPATATRIGRAPAASRTATCRSRHAR